jgi:hypothetical protein
MAAPIETRRGGPLDPPRLLPPLPAADERGAAGGWLTAPPPDPPWVIGLWGASCFYCRKGLADLVPRAARAGVPFVALHVPEFPDDEAPGAPERTLAELGLPVGHPGVHHHRDARAWSARVAMAYWPTFLVVDADRRATFVLVGWAGHGDAAYGPLERAIAATASTRPPLAPPHP